MNKFIVPIMVSFFLGGLIIGVYVVPQIKLENKENFTIIKQTAVVKPLGYKIVTDERTKQSFVAMEVSRVEYGYDSVYNFRTLNDTAVRQITLHDARLNVGDLVVYEQITQTKECNMGVQLKVPDFESVWFENILTKNFTEKQLPGYYRERYDIKTDFSTCDIPVITKWNSVYRNGELIEKMQLERTGYEI